MVPKWVKDTSILKEFTPWQQLQFFGLRRDKTIHHIDTLYYSVYLNEPKRIIELQHEGELPANLASFLTELRRAKESIRDYSAELPHFGELVLERKSFSIYEWCISLPECFDIFISSYLPTAETPRVVVQLRSRFLVLEGVRRAVEVSFRYLREFLSPFGLLPVRVRENRIDYAFHTNLIQNPDRFFDDDKLRRHCKTNLRKFSKYGDTREFKLDTLNLGRRSSNNVFFRGYNKGREMVEMNYKAFFIERWFREGLISSFDKYVYETAYRMKAYRSGILVGRLKWYIEYGRNEELKKECLQLLATDFVRSDNYDHIEKKLQGVIPEPTLIFNVEYQCKRKFFATCQEWISFKTDIIEHLEVPYGQAVDSKLALPQFCDPLLRELFGIIFSGREVVDYLTGFGNVVSFVEDRSMSLKEFRKAEEPYMRWWHRLRSTPIDYGYSTVVELYRRYDARQSFDRSRRILEGNVARLSMIANQHTDRRSFVEDMADVLCIVNDNDTRGVSFRLDKAGLMGDGEDLPEDLSRLDPKDYQEIRYRKSRQLRGVLKKSDEEEKNAAPTQELGEKEG